MAVVLLLAGLGRDPFEYYLLLLALHQKLLLLEACCKQRVWQQGLLNTETKMKNCVSSSQPWLSS